ATALPGLTQENAAARAGGLVLGIGATFVVALAWFLVVCFMQGGGGSVGMRVMKLQLVRADTGAPLGFGRALLRNIVFGLSTAIVVGYFTPLFDGSGLFQGWHDKAAGAIVLDVRGAAAPAPAAPHPASPAAAAVPVATASPVAPVAAWDDPDGATVTSLPPRPADPVASAAVPPQVAPPQVVPAQAVQPQIADPDEAAMITTVPGISPSAPVAAPAPTPVTGPEAALAAAPAAPAAPPAEDPAAEPATAPTATVASAQSGSAGAAGSAPLPAAVDVEDDDAEDTRISIPGHRLLFVWDDGVRAIVSGRTLFGRNPAAEPGASVVVVRDETLSLSKTHFEAAAENAGGWVRDRHSTNGTTVVRDGVRIACPPGERVRIRLGDAIEIGERIVTVGGYA
ncbi:RDD family protein, partial [Microbacterium sp. 13-71-7]|uniref:RDD family protein n=1 Tax=Microbacterium sp. 13-71-7 TaxID=1970399 RepID=UPI000BD518AB